MKLLPYLLFVCTLAGFAFDRAEAENFCVEGDSSSSVPFLIADEVIWDTQNLGSLPFPKVKNIEKGQPFERLTWIKMPKGMTATSTVIGRYQGHDVVDITYTDAAPNLDNPHAPFFYKLLAYEGKNKRLRPFFILGGDNTRWYEQFFSSSKEIPFGLCVSITIPGNGVYTSSYFFAFSQNGPWLRDKSDGGRGVKTKEIIYNEKGKILETNILEFN